MTSSNSSNNNNRHNIDFTPDENDPSTYKYFPDNPTSFESQMQFNIKEPSLYFDPCEESARMSRRCLEDNWDNPDKKTICKEFFKAYKDCKAMWISQRR